MTIQQQSVSRNIDQILNESKLLYERFELFITKFEKVGDKLRQVTTAYNDSIKSYSKQLRPQALKIAELSSSTNSPKNLEELNEQITSLSINNRTE
jgi:DNA anti-recombination protein RmuC